MARARNIGYILVLACDGGLSPESPLKGSAALESIDYFDLQGRKEGDKLLEARTQLCNGQE